MFIILSIVALATTFGLVKGWHSGDDGALNKPLWFYFLAGFTLWWILYGTLSKNGSIEVRESWVRLGSDMSYFFEFGILNSFIFGVIALVVILIIRGIKASN